MSLSKKKIYIFGCTMWDIVGKPSEPISKGKDCSGFINERPGGVAFNIALGLSKVLNKRNFELNLVSAIGKNEKTSLIQNALEKNNISTKYLLIRGNQNDQYLSIETKKGEIFGSVNSSSTFLSSQDDIIEHFSQICLAHKNENSNAIFIFDGNCTREFLNYVKKEASKKIFTKYFIPANFSKLAEFKNDAIYFKGFNLFINLKEANILLNSKKLKNAVDASIAIFKKIRTETSLTIVTDGSNIACGVSNEEVATVQPKVIGGTYSRLGAGDAFFAYFLSYKELNPSASLNKSLYAANRKTRNYLKAND